MKRNLLLLGGTVELVKIIPVGGLKKSLDLPVCLVGETAK